MRQKETFTDRYTAAAGLGSAIDITARQYGVDITPICQALGIDPASFNDVTARISIDRISRLLETCALLTNDQAFGLKCCDQFTPGATGPFGFGLMAAPTALDFMRFTSEYICNVSELSYSKLTINEQGAEFVWTYSPIVLNATQFGDLGIGLQIARLKAIVGASIDAVEVGLERAKPDNLAPYRERLPRKLSFGRRINNLRLPTELLSMVNPAGDRRLFQLMEIQCRTFQPASVGERPFSEELKEFLQQRISENSIGLSEAAQFFHVSERTLQRRLLENGTSLADARDEVRRDLAHKFLVETDLSAAEISLRLGYSQPSAFSRSAVRWFGVTPRDYRRVKGSAA